MRERIKTPPDDGGLWSGPKIALGDSIQQPRSQYPQAATQEERAALKKMEDAAAEEQCQHPDAEVEIWAMVEHRLGLKPIVRDMRAPIGARPVALGHHRFEWLYVFVFVEPATGRTVWNITNAVCKEMFEQVLADFAKSIGAGTSKRIVLQNDNAGWHGPQNLAVLDGIRFVFQPSHSPELQPAEHLWAFVDEPLANRCFASIESLDQAVGERCVTLTQQTEMIRASTFFHWWPRQATQN